jgi:polysaccharide export outer membrane protein
MISLNNPVKTMMRFLQMAFAQTALLLAGLFAATAVLAQSAANDYPLGAGDVVRVQVFQNLDMTTEARVSEAGEISLPLIGAVKVGGLTPGDAEKLIATRLRDGGFMQRAQVTVNVQQFRSQQVSVLGSVGRPGRYPLEQRGVRLTEMLATAGGILPTGSDTLILIRREGGKTTRTTVDLPSLYLNDRPDLDIEVKGGDSIYVHRASVIYVFGQVQRPGQFTLEREMNVRQALAKAGGFTMRAREQKVLVQRIGRDGKSVESELGLDDAVLADDQIYVRESLF